MGEPGGWTEVLWQALGIGGACVFYGRFYIQWIVSEIKKRSVIPIAFWYLSSGGSLALLAYGVHIASPLGTLSQSLNTVIYSRNLVHIWRERGVLSKRRNVLVHAAVAAVAVTALWFTALIWLNEYQTTRSGETADARQTWLWLGIGLVGQGLFAGRFLIQWIATELRRKSVVPTVFWYLSVVAASLLMASFVQRREWVYAVGLLATTLVYLRNLWFIHKGKPVASD